MKRIEEGSRILIVGLGLIGGSYADALSRQGYEVGAVDPDPEALAFARRQGWIRDGREDPDPEFLKQFSLVVLALYPHLVTEWVRTWQACLPQGALLTDVTGVKCPMIYEIQSLLREDLAFIGAHPMAGRERSGVWNASADIFQNANYIVTPTERNTPEETETCRELGRILGFSSISELSPEKHDEMVGFLSQLTHCIAISLMTCRDSEHFTEYTGDSFRDLTRIARINDEMWSELFLLNRKELLRQMDLFSDQFHRLYLAIEQEDREGIRVIMRESTEQRKRFDKR